MIAMRTGETKGMRGEPTHREWWRVTGAAEWKYQPTEWPLPICYLQPPENYTAFCTSIIHDNTKSAAIDSTTNKHDRTATQEQHRQLALCLWGFERVHQISAGYFKKYQFYKKWQKVIIKWQMTLNNINTSCWLKQWLLTSLQWIVCAKRTILSSCTPPDVILTKEDILKNIC